MATGLPPGLRGAGDPASGGRLFGETLCCLAPRPSRGFRQALEDLRPRRAYVVYPGREAFPLGEGVWAIPLLPLMRALWSGTPDLPG
ncbi:hypothetical protein [Thermus filiformis]|uniref:hypothetical protein n=1 Tax=Thermus filiformis TaxID=276 RepID=UPI000AB8A2C7|nr:hypothetical protein [Thermus filiformis]